MDWQKGSKDTNSNTFCMYHIFLPKVLNSVWINYAWTKHFGSNNRHSCLIFWKAQNKDSKEFALALPSIRSLSWGNLFNHFWSAFSHRYNGTSVKYLLEISLRINVSLNWNKCIHLEKVTYLSFITKVIERSLMWHQKPKVRIGHDDKLSDLGQITELTYGLRSLLMFHVSQSIDSDSKSLLPLWHKKAYSKEERLSQTAFSVKLYNFWWLYIKSP